MKNKKNPKQVTVLITDASGKETSLTLRRGLKTFVQAPFEVDANFLRISGRVDLKIELP